MRDHALTVTDVDDRDDRWRFTVTLLAEKRFGLVFEILDRAYLTRMRRERGCGVKPWRTHSRLPSCPKTQTNSRPAWAATSRCRWLNSLEGISG